MANNHFPEVRGKLPHAPSMLRDGGDVVFHRTEALFQNCTIDLEQADFQTM